MKTPTAPSLSDRVSRHKNHSPAPESLYPNAVPSGGFQSLENQPEIFQQPERSSSRVT
jgi:hypothetical protein